MYASALQHYNTAIDDVSARVQQDRVLHMHDLTSVYMQAVSTDMPEEYLTMLEKSIGERSIYNDRKLVMDASDLTVQNSKLTGAMGTNARTLSGGGVRDFSREAMAAMHYSAKRSNALHASFNQKLQHDRSVHTSELEALASITPSHTTCGSVLSTLVQMRHENNDARTVHDAGSWADLDAQVMDELGAGRHSADVLSHGLSVTMAASTPRMSGGGGPNFRFANSDAAQLWQNVMYG